MFSKRSLISIIVVLLIALAITGGVFTFKYFTEKPGRTDAASLAGQIGKSVQLPNEQPTLFTIADKSKISNKALGQRVDNGDELLFFKSARKVVIYRPSTKKVIDMLTIESPKAP